MKRQIKSIFSNIFKLFGFRVDFVKISKNEFLIPIYDADKINLCCGNQKIDGYIGIDIINTADIVVDLSKQNIPIPNNSVDVLICISAINYFTYHRGEEIIKDVYRVLKPGGIARFGVQDMEAIARRYINRDNNFFFQKLPDGKERFEGPTIGDKFAAWFYGYTAGGSPCQYFYDYPALEYLFLKGGFSVVEKKSFLESRLSDIDKIDNRPDQMFFLEAIK